MRIARRLALVLAGLTAAGAADEATLCLYLKPLPAEAARLRFRPEAVSALWADGASVPLGVRLREVSAAAADRPRLLAAGELPPGAYLGFSVRAASAALRGDAGDTALRSVEAGMSAPFEFRVEAGRPIVVEIELRYRESVREEFEFAPSFAASRPRRPAVDVLGVVTLRDRDAVALFDRVTGQVVQLVATARGPRGLALDSRLRRAYVGCAGEDVVQAIDLSDPRVVVSRRLRSGDEPVAIALTPDGRTLLSANARSGTVSLLDAASLTERARLGVGNRPSYLRIDRNGRRAFVFHEMADAIHVLDLPTATVSAIVASEGGPFRGELDGSGSRLYVIHRASPYLEAFDTATLERVGQVYVGPGATALAVDRRRDRILVGYGDPPRVEVFEALSLLPADSIASGARVEILAEEAQGNNLCMVLASARELRLVRLVGHTVVTIVELPEEPGEVAFLGDR
jgi:YVTN family beta-propeller protein